MDFLKSMNFCEIIATSKKSHTSSERTEFPEEEYYVQDFFH